MNNGHVSASQARKQFLPSCNGTDGYFPSAHVRDPDFHDALEDTWELCTRLSASGLWQEAEG